MSLNKKTAISIILVSPSLFFNYISLTILDHDHNLSVFSILFIILFNLLNIIFAFVYYKKNFKIFFSFLTYCFFLFLIFDFALEKILNIKSITKEDNVLGWTLKSNKEVVFNQNTYKGEKYDVKFKTSSVEGFREYGNLKDKNKNILIIGDSYTGGPYASDDEMYYSVIRDIFIKNDINLNWFIMGAGGYGTTQQLILLEKHLETIKPDILLHQFCVNDFFDNSDDISALSTSHNQYYRRPYFKNNKIFKINDTFSNVYRFFYKYSYIFKKFDQIYNYKQFRAYGRFTKEIPEEFIIKSINNTQDLIVRMRKLVGTKTLYFSVNCADKKRKALSLEWERIIKKIGGFPLIEPSNTLIKMKDGGIDVNHEDGGHLNPYGNKIYGELTAIKMMDIMKNEKY